MIEAAGHELAVDLPPDSLPLDADSVRLAQVLANLLNNAAKYTPPGGRIWLRASRAGDEAVVSVRDDGAGIPADMLPKIFELFTQVERTYNSAQGGLGIGLTLARSLVNLHGGSIEARSDGPGRGSEFVVRLPLSLEQLTAKEANPPQKLKLAQRILVVDDNHDSADSLSMLLELCGAEVHTAYGGEEALQAVRIYRPTVVLLDIGLPDIDGYEIARRARQESAQITLIALTGWSQESDRQRSKEAGIDHHLVKPVDLVVLERVLTALPT
jgi:CheY-like chemotaxis protein